MSRSRAIVIAACVLWLAHVAVLFGLGNRPPGSLVSDIIQLALGGLLAFSATPESAVFS